MKKLMCCAALWGIGVILLLSYIGAGINTSAQIPEIGFGALDDTSVYEYLVIDIEIKVSAEVTKQELDLHGQQGWLAVSVASVKGAHRYVLVRKKGFGMSISEIYSLFHVAGLDVMARTSVHPVELVVHVPGGNEGLVAFLPHDPTDWKEAATYIIRRVRYYAEHMDEFALLQEEPDSTITNIVLSMN